MLRSVVIGLGSMCVLVLLVLGYQQSSRLSWPSWASWPANEPAQAVAVAPAPALPSPPPIVTIDAALEGRFKAYTDEKLTALGDFIGKQAGQLSVLINAQKDALATFEQRIAALEKSRGGSASPEAASPAVVAALARLDARLEALEKRPALPVPAAASSAMEAALARLNTRLDALEKRPALPAPTATAPAGSTASPPVAATAANVDEHIKGFLAVYHVLAQLHPDNIARYYADTVVVNGKRQSKADYLAERLATFKRYDRIRIAYDPDTLKITPLDTAGFSYRLVYRNTSTLMKGTEGNTTSWSVDAVVRRSGDFYKFEEIKLTPG